jgi:hypothetical protein
VDTGLTADNATSCALSTCLDLVALLLLLLLCPQVEQLDLVQMHW